MVRQDEKANAYRVTSEKFVANANAVRITTSTSSEDSNLCLQPNREEIPEEGRQLHPSTLFAGPGDHQGRALHGESPRRVDESFKPCVCDSGFKRSSARRFLKAGV